MENYENGPQTTPTPDEEPVFDEAIALDPEEKLEGLEALETLEEAPSYVPPMPKIGATTPPPQPSAPYTAPHQPRPTYAVPPMYQGYAYPPQGQRVYAPGPGVPYPSAARPVYQPPVYQSAPPRPATPPVKPPVTPPPAPPSAEGPKKSDSKIGKQLLCAGLVVALVLGSCGITAALINSHWKKQNELQSLALNDKIRVLQEQIDEDKNENEGTSSSGTPNVTPDGSLTPAQVYAQNVTSVVAIEGSNAHSASSGSGFVLTEDGYIVSNHHVVEDSTTLKVIFSDGTQYDAELVGSDSSNDIAVLKIDAQDLRPAAIGSSDALIVGDQVVAIGNPLGELASTLTVGYVSAKDRIITTEGTRLNMIQTDAAINPGNSGGPLFNMKGEVVGITTAKYSGTTSSGASIEGIGFAIPMDDVYDMIGDLREHGYVTGAFLGVTVSDVPQQDVELYGLPTGVLIHEVISGSCSQAAGLHPQDIIVELGGYEISNMNDLTRALRHFQAGDEISVIVYRHSEGGQLTFSVTLDEKPAPGEDTGDTSDGSSGSTNDADDWFDHFFG